tara:strand:+ start:1791 stop:2027 length:237 start_codon:yes stop_codon:yes gene_type:complete
MAKITEEQLKKVVEQNKQLEETVIEIGVLESKKHALLHKVAELNNVLEESKKELEEEYGKISIDLKTGEYTKIEKEEE